MSINRQSIGLFFGSFNPIHIGHLIIANHMLNEGNVDEIWFVVSPQNPLKERKTLLSDHHRLEMVNMAIEDNDRMRSCDVEFKMPIPSYTIDTLAVLFDKYPNKDFQLIMGSDNLVNLHKWKSYKSILETTKILVYPRPEAPVSNIDTHSAVTITNAPHIELSSSLIRQLIKDKKSIKYMVPPSVEQYIQNMHFYEK